MHQTAQEGAQWPNVTDKTCATLAQSKIIMGQYCELIVAVLELTYIILYSGTVCTVGSGKA